MKSKDKKKTKTVYDLYLVCRATGKRMFSRTYQNKSVKLGAENLERKYSHLGYETDIKSREVPILML